MKTPCWIWKGQVAGAGYGTVYLRGRSYVRGKQRTQYVHRVVYELVHGPIPSGMEIDHLCRENLCFNPDHLEAVTHAENRRRARSKVCIRGHVLEGQPEVPGHGRRCRKCDAIRAAKKRAKRASLA